jgi:pimeloyl-ACP methyl ester carboxylesterase
MAAFSFPKTLIPTETLATLREVALLPRDLRAKIPRPADEDDVVVLVHGFFATAGVWRPMRERIERDLGAHVATFSHAPGARVDRIARRLGALVDKLPRRARVHLVGHSLGGVVARWYVQEHGGHARVAQTISLGSPFFGAPGARRFPFLVGKDLHSASALLARVRARAHEHDVPHTSIVAEHDAVTPGGSACFPSGDVLLLSGVGHNSLLFDDQAIGHVVDRVRAARAAR